MLTNFTLKNFKGHRHTDLVLKPFTILVGDNGSGKTSVLEALRFLHRIAFQQKKLGFFGMVEKPDAVDELFRRGSSSIALSAGGQTSGVRWTVMLSVTQPVQGINSVALSGSDNQDGLSASGDLDSGFNSYQGDWSRVRQWMGNAALYRFRADQVAASSYSDQPETFVEEDGAQTAVVLATLKLADDDAFGRIEAAMRRLVPTLERVRIKPAKVSHPGHSKEVVGSKLYFDFRGAKDVPGHHASHGTLITLALLAVLYGPGRPSLLLLDDFDHALHPRAQMELVRMLKALQELEALQETQIIATTHSPYVLDELSLENVIAFALRDDGTVASKPLTAHPDAAKMKGTLRTGQLWSLDAERDWVLQ